LVQAHLNQICNNFKDPGVQHYGGPLFRQLRDQLDDIFCNLPPPQPSIKKRAPDNTYQYAPPVNMRTYHNVDNGCFDGMCSVLLADESRKLVKNIRKGDYVATPNGPTKVLCVIKFPCKNQTTDLVELEGGLKLTPYHPIRVEGQWRFPCELAIATPKFCPAVFTFVLENFHILLIDGVECVTLGHDFTDDVVKHPYFGSQRIIEDLKKMSGWSSGLVTVDGQFVRDPKTDMISGFRSKGQENSVQQMNSSKFLTV